MFIMFEGKYSVSTPSSGCLNLKNILYSPFRKYVFDRDFNVLRKVPQNQCCESGMFIPDPGS
jgi:hypothetical protein